MKQRADLLTVTQGLAPSREAARRRIMAGEVFCTVGGRTERVAKPGQLLPAAAVLSATAPPRFVSRGGDKLMSALEGITARGLELPLAGAVALDAGASTGGFTDCLLQHGAARVYAVDVGRGQLHVRLRQDPRVVSLEGVNLRHAPADLIPEPVHVVVADCSFISLRHILPPCITWLAPGGYALALVKPQFEVGPRWVGKGGVVRDEAARLAAVEGIRRFAEEELGLTPLATIPSAVLGPKGNQEYFLFLRWEKSSS
ncbi:MAG: putative hemolysin [Desulfomicrobiaceae bacterium]|jgi:23S rRNA (cytidine1920-2'-O)/16S rRNA (cytidine1409-2'-O)-methyltransferase|nr:putative hemolysin [Desulfomicrobiaceae bacterium]MBZ4684620.1 putative hemolysin [Desulfomicrobiaceae bacterium]MDK2873384.1 rRNA (cytidine1920-2-O)/16S rRNA (cytidine1409-2-O)-methyltransferase [Desulfomicrobiaceae bacterium]HCF05286.1 TlyA family rRNA (cytidine-2'-O)-methyltransferase [Desulfomicrobiaceae bacterium]